MTAADVEYFEKKMMELLDTVVTNQESQREDFENFREELFDKIDNLSVGGDGFQVE